MFDARLEQALKDRAGPARTRGVELGKQAALAILERREQDGSITAEIGDYEPRSGPGAYQFVPPFDLAFAPGWRAVEPFALQAPSQFRPEPPPARTSPEYTVAFDEVKMPGGQGSSARDPEHADAAAEVLASVIGDGTPFTVGSTTAPAEMPTRTFESFTAAADENADSRVRGGLHFRFSCQEGSGWADGSGTSRLEDPVNEGNSALLTNDGVETPGHPPRARFTKYARARACRSPQPPQPCRGAGRPASRGKDRVRTLDDFVDVR